MARLVVKDNITSGGALAVGQTLRLGGFVMTARSAVAPTMTSRVIKKLPSRRVWPTAKAPLATAPSLKTGCGILPNGDDIVELSMKAPMSVSKPADLG